MTAGTLIFWLFLITLVAAIAFALVQWVGADRSQKKHGDPPDALERKIGRQQQAVEAERDS